MEFNYLNNNKIQKLNIHAGQNWSSYKNKDDKSSLNSIFDIVDNNSDGKVDDEELNILQKLLKIADSQIDKFKDNNIIEEEELKLLIDKIKNLKLSTLDTNKSPKGIFHGPTHEIIKIPDDINKKNFTFLEATYDANFDGDEVKDIVFHINKYAIDYSFLKNLQEGRYNIDSWNASQDANGIRTFSPILKKIQNSNQDGTKIWSEGINRNISKIQFNKASCDSNLLSFISIVGEEQGFIVELIDSVGTWIEDFSVVRADKKQLIPDVDSHALRSIYQDSIISDRLGITPGTQGHASQMDNGKNTQNALRYSYLLSEKDVIYGKTYLEGGNVLNTLTKDGEPAAIIGEESLKYTIIAIIKQDLGNNPDIFEKIEEVFKNNSEEYINKAKLQIAQELGIKKENITYIPQFDFHIDMHYRPLNDGQIAIPDYGAGINVLNGLIDDINQEMDSADIEPEQKDKLQNQKEDYQKLLDRLEKLNTITAKFSKAAEEELKNKGYEIVRIPSFTDLDDGSKQPMRSSVENPINYMNGICGTSQKTGNKFYITNTSGDEKLDTYMEQYFIEVVGFDKVYFAPTKKYLASQGGIDCLTKEF